jgi:peptide/nickel transport system substrate-binding protein
MAEYHLVILPAAPPEQIGLDGIGTGPFMFKDGDPKRRYVLERHPNYWRQGFPFLDRLEVVAQTMEGAMNGYQSGQFDAVFDVDPGLLSRIETMEDTKISYASSGDQALMVLPKYAGSPFMDKRIRQALALAIDREAIRRIVYRNDGGWVGNDSHLASVDPNFLPRSTPRDVTKAKQLLEEAGHPNGITLPTFYFNVYYPELPRVFQVLAESVKEAGITLPLEQRPTDGYRSWRVEDKEKTRKHRFAFGPVGTRNPGISLFRMARPDYNESGYWHPSPEGDRYIALYKEAVVTGDPEARRKIYHEMQRILHDEVPAILPGGRKNTIAHRANVHGVKAHPQQWSVRFDEIWKA